ncbi:cytochrome-c peroxidase [Rhodovulum visakhapatnamense]|uniref:Cytochrome c peroxidase n=1 Tax=Rhodovulum visakhapatnamense TaxID=364297 RepID=A0A4R8FJD6_9RHOB|nr:cytochrome-c peroxidase [Rhodovulum visakhapatnamense]TDX25422.1 cytochrome c peroxidase [Rhodovulum visakhapatnamense]
MTRLATALMAALAAPQGLAGSLPVPLSDADFATAPEAETRLGQLLFFDPILSGNRSISCATCHHPRFATGDGLSLGLGEGGIGLGPARRADPANPPERLIPRNAPPLFNMGAAGVTVLFADGRIETDASRPTGFRTPMEDEMVAGFANLLSAQTMFPVLSPDEMAGHYQENDVARAVRQGFITGPGGAWDRIAGRVAALPAYRTRFEAVYPEIAAGRPVAFTDISNAIAAFVAAEWRADDSAFDRALRGGPPLTGPAAEGQALFYGRAGCDACHSGPLLSDMGFHAMGAPQLGPGKVERFETGQADPGRFRVTGHAADAFAFRTSMLRNVTRTGPWGHAGGDTDLRAFLARHAAPQTGLARHPREAVLPHFDNPQPVWAVLDDPEARAAIEAAALPGPGLAADEIEALMAFLEALTDETALAGRLGIPDAVPSGLPVDR